MRAKRMSNFLDKFNLVDQDCRHLMFWHSEHTWKEAASLSHRQALSFPSTEPDDISRVDAFVYEKSVNWSVGGKRRFFCGVKWKSPFPFTF